MRCLCNRYIDTSMIFGMYLVWTSLSRDVDQGTLLKIGLLNSVSKNVSGIV